MSDENPPRIYLACLASYNEGQLHGDWIELDGTQDIYEQLHNILDSSPIAGAEEWAVHDHENCGALGEYPGLVRLEAIRQAYERAEEDGLCWDTFVAWCEHQGVDISPEQIDGFHDSLAGCAESLEAWCDEYLEETGQLEAIPEALRHYFNVAAYAHDLELTEIFTIKHDNSVLVFWHS